jgi:hypothetical protein
MASKEELCRKKLITTYSIERMMQIYAQKFTDKARAINHIHTVRVEELKQMGNIKII